MVKIGEDHYKINYLTLNYVICSCERYVIVAVVECMPLSQMIPGSISK